MREKYFFWCLAALLALCLTGAGFSFPAAASAASRDLVFEDDDGGKGASPGTNRDLVFEEDGGKPQKRSDDLEPKTNRKYTAADLNAMFQKGESLRKANRDGEAVPILEEYVAGAKALVGEDHQAVINGRYSLGFAANDSGDFRKAAFHLSKVLTALTQEGGPESLPNDRLVVPLILGMAQNEIGDADGAIVTMTTYLPLLAEKFSKKPDILAQCLDVIAEAAKKKHEYQLAVTAYEKALGYWIAAEGKTSQNALSDALLLGEAYSLAGAPAKGLALLRDTEQALNKAKKPDISAILKVKNNQAGKLMDMGRYDQARQVYEEVLEMSIRVNGKDSEDALMTLGNLASAWSDLGENKKALDLNLQAQEGFTRTLGPDSRRALSTALNAVNSYKSLNRYDEGLALVEKTLDACRKTLGEKDLLTFRAWNTLGQLLIEVGEYDKAIKTFENNLAAMQGVLPEGHGRIITAWEGIAVTYARRDDAGKDMEKASKYLSKVWKARESRQGQTHPDTLLAELNYVSSQADLKQYAEAKAHLERLLPVMEKTFGPQHVAYLRARGNLAILYRDMGEPAKSAEMLKDLLFDVKASGNARMFMNVSAALRKAYQETGDLDSAVFFGQQAVAAGQSLRKNLAKSAPEVRSAFARSMTSTYQGLADVLMAQGKVSEAQQVMALLKADELADVGGGAASGAAGSGADASGAGRADRAGTGAAAPSASILAGVNEETAKRYQEISDKLVALGEEQRALLERKNNGETLSDAEEARLKTLRQDMTAARKVFTSFVDSLSAELSKGKDKRTADLGNLETYQRLLTSMGEGTVLLQTILTEDRLWLILTTPNALVAKESPLKVAELPRMVTAFRKVLQDPDVDARPLAKEFYDAIVGPLAPSLEQAGAKTVMFSLDGQLRYLPMATLYDGKQWLVQKYAVTLFNEATKASLAVPQAGNWRVAGLGVTKQYKFGRGTFPALPSVKDELKSIVKNKDNEQGVLQGTMTLDEGFTKEKLAEVLESGAPVVHLATHFHFEAKKPEDSFLLLGDGTGLYLPQIESEDFKFKSVDLLALSACQTAQGGVDATGKEIEGFGALAQKRGAKAVMATLWPVNDESTGMFMSNVYRLHEDKDKKPSIAGCMRQTQMAMIDGQLKGSESFAHPYFWGPFVLMGDWR